ncbi:penicillin-binding protein 1B [Rheinheimera sp. WS51]|uniref:penicillin-binding protein 1B n=1 Tax=Rheinheimera sp. WS51 TaxID=3425886 RepID=UPI003D8C7EAF
MSSKSNKSKTKTNKKQSAAVKSAKLGRLFKRWVFTLLKLALVLFLILVFYFIYLDSKITKKFSGQKWQVPAQIYARSMTLLPGKKISQQQLLQQLDALQYQRNAELASPGQYSVSRDHITIYRRPFTFIDGYETAQLFSVEFKRGSIHRITQRLQEQPINFARLEPQLIEHLVSPHQEDRELVRLEQVPEIFKDTLLLVEDRNFYHHHGVSPLAVLRALWVNITAGRTVQGGSTLTQQLAKNMYLSNERTLLRKVNEALIAIILDYRFNKDQILEAYLNEVFVGQKYATAVHGVGLGSRFYFGKPLAELSISESALLVGLLKGPSYFDPRRHPERALQRRDLVLRLMFEQHFLSRHQYEAAVMEPLFVIPRAKLSNASYSSYIDAVKKELRQLNLAHQLRQSGIKVFTHLDIIAQQDAEEAVASQLQKYDEALQAAVIVTEYQQADIVAVVGSRTQVDSGFNRALDAKRQIGSIIKPVIYLEALAQKGRYSLATKIEDTAIRLRSNNQDWQPQNFDKQFRGPVSLLDALANSLNVPTVRLGLQLGLPNISKGLEKLGLERDIKLHPAALLGAIELSPIEVSQLYQTIANSGLHRKQSTLLAITDNNGHILYQRQDALTRRYSEAEMYLLHYGLIQAATTGTAKSLTNAFPQQVLAGKTGTSSDYRDSWFVGFDQHKLVTVWLGKDNNNAIGLTGSSGALPVFSRFFRQQGVSSILRLMPEQISLQAFSVTSGYPQPEHCSSILLLPAFTDESMVVDGCEN